MNAAALIIGVLPGITVMIEAKPGAAMAPEDERRVVPRAQSGQKGGG
jgi:hypothetical protein